jgi:hypothetical protein
VRLDLIGSQLANLVPDFDARTYGFGKLCELVRKTGAFDVEKTEGGHNRIRARPAKKSGKGK